MGRGAQRFFRRNNHSSGGDIFQSSSRTCRSQSCRCLAADLLSVILLSNSLFFVLFSFLRTKCFLKSNVPSGRWDVGLGFLEGHSLPALLLLQGRSKGAIFSPHGNRVLNNPTTSQLLDAGVSFFLLLPYTTAFSVLLLQPGTRGSLGATPGGAGSAHVPKLGDRPGSTSCERGQQLGNSRAKCLPGNSQLPLKRL